MSYLHRGKVQATRSETLHAPLKKPNYTGWGHLAWIWQSRPGEMSDYNKGGVLPALVVALPRFCSMRGVLTFRRAARLVQSSNSRLRLTR
jgi:hypothetical protein